MMSIANISEIASDLPKIRTPKKLSPSRLITLFDQFKPGRPEVTRFDKIVITKWPLAICPFAKKIHIRHRIEIGHIDPGNVPFINCLYPECSSKTWQNLNEAGFSIASLFEDKDPNQHSSLSEQEIDELASLIGDHEKIPKPDSIVWRFRQCIFGSHHKNNKSWIIRHNNGALGAGCFIPGCGTGGWQELKEIVYR